MAVLKIVKMGAPDLAVKAMPVTGMADEVLQNCITDMIETMRHYQGVGLAAPQIGLALQIVVLEVAQNIRYPHAATIELEVLINPQIINYSENLEVDWEGCLSLPGLRGHVKRPDSITYQALNREGEQVKRTVSGFHARIIQHEVDHLNGILYPQRLDNFQDFGFEDSIPDFQQS